MSAYRRDFDETKFMSFLIKDDEYKFGKKLKTVSKRNLTVKLYTMKNI